MCAMTPFVPLPGWQLPAPGSPAERPIPQQRRALKRKTAPQRRLRDHGGIDRSTRHTSRLGGRCRRPRRSRALRTGVRRRPSAEVFEMPLWANAGLAGAQTGMMRAMAAGAWGEGVGTLLKCGQALVLLFSAIGLGSARSDKNTPPLGPDSRDSVRRIQLQPVRTVVPDLDAPTEQCR